MTFAAIAHPVLRHRVITNYAAEAEGYNVDRLIAHVVQLVDDEPTDEDAHAGAAHILKS
jgi:hypothetical protein